MATSPHLTDKERIFLRGLPADRLRHLRDHAGKMLALYDDWEKRSGAPLDEIAAERARSIATRDFLQAELDKRESKQANDAPEELKNDNQSNETRSAAAFEAVVRKHGDPNRVFVESAILRLIGELHGDAEARYREMNDVMFPDADGIDETMNFASVTNAQVKWIRDLWQKERAKKRGVKAVDFARKKAHDFVYPEIDLSVPSVDRERLSRVSRPPRSKSK
jgi:hypothetical protein